MGSGVPQYAKNENHTRTCVTRFGSTAGLTVPVLNTTSRMSTTGANSTLRLSGVEAKKKVFNHRQETQENSSEDHDAEQT